jgi:hypothetical protein
MAYGPTATDHPSTLPSGIPFPNFNPYHQQDDDYDDAYCAKTKQPHRFSIRIMPSELARDHRPWLSRLRSALRLLIVVLSGAVAGTLIHTLEIYRGNISLDLRHGELPMTWPARTNLAPTLVLFAVAASNFLASVAVMVMSFKRSFRRPIRSRDAYRIFAGCFGVVMWATALIAFNLLDRASRASLGRYACSNKNVMSNGRYQYSAVCSEQVKQLILAPRKPANASQGLAFYLAIGAACAEVVTLSTLGVTAMQSAKERNSIMKIDEKANMGRRLTGRYP